MYKFRGKDKQTGEWRYGLLFRKLKKYTAIQMCTHGKRIESSLYIQTCKTVNDTDVLEEFEVIPETVGQLRHTKDGVEYFDGDIYYHAGYGEETVGDLCELQMALMDGHADDIGTIKSNIHDKQ